VSNLTAEQRAALVASAEVVAMRYPAPWRKVGDTNWRIKGFPQVEMGDPKGSYFPVHDDVLADYLSMLDPTFVLALLADLAAAEGENARCLAADIARQEAADARVAAAEGERDALRKRITELERRSRTRPDYDLRCEDCGAPHWFDTSIPSKVWNQIAAPHMVLCLLCIDARLQEAGLTCDKAEFYFSGTALRSRLYADSHGDVQALEAERDRLAARVGVLEAGLSAAEHAFRNIHVRLSPSSPEWKEAYEARNMCGTLLAATATAGSATRA
jgi:hypothetical protein